MKALENNTTIRKLNLSYNLIAKNSLKIIEKTVSNNLTLVEIRLKEKPMDLNGMRFDALPAQTLKTIEDCVRDNILVQKARFSHFHASYMNSNISYSTSPARETLSSCSTGNWSVYQGIYLPTSISPL